MQHLRMTESQAAAHQARVGAGVVAPVAVVEKPRKYNNIPTEVDGILFGSRKEAKRYGELILLQQSGQIRGLSCHDRYSLDVNGVHICDYECDFAYWRGDVRCLEDTKGVRTPAFKLKALLILAIYGVRVIEL